MADHESQRHHRVDTDSKRPARDRSARGQLLEVGRSLAQCFEDTKLVGREKVLGGHEPHGGLHDHVGSHSWTGRSRVVALCVTSGRCGVAQGLLLGVRPGSWVN